MSIYWNLHTDTYMKYGPWTIADITEYEDDKLIIHKSEHIAGGAGGKHGTASIQLKYQTQGYKFAWYEVFRV